MADDDRTRDDSPPKEPTHAPGEDAPVGRPRREPYPVNDPGLVDPARTPGAEPDVLPVGGGRPIGTM